MATGIVSKDSNEIGGKNMAKNTLKEIKRTPVAIGSTHDSSAKLAIAIPASLPSSSSCSAEADDDSNFPSAVLIDETLRIIDDGEEEVDQEGNEETLPSIHPRKYAESAFLRNGCEDLEAIARACEGRMKPPTPEMLEAYLLGEIVAAVRKNDVEQARLLFEEGKFGSPGVNACNRFGESVLHIACRRGHCGMVRFLVEDVGLSASEIRDDYHRTPLHDAFWTATASPDLVDFLLRQPRVPDLLLCEDRRGYTPLDYTHPEDRDRWLRFLRERKQLLRPAPTTRIASAASCPDLPSLASPSSRKKKRLPRISSVLAISEEATTETTTGQLHSATIIG